VFKYDLPAVWIAGILVVAILAFAVYGESTPGYSWYQTQFKSLVDDKFGAEKAAFIEPGVKQIWVEAANKVDRCTTCHSGVTWTGLEDADEPFRSHPKDILASHPVEKFGCTYCHGGQGYAVALPDAHGWVKHWEEPLLDSTLDSDYGFGKSHAFIEMRCNLCHRYDRETEGMPLINKAKKLINEKGCRACHTINGRGGSIGPDLTDIGEKGAEQYDFERLTNAPTVFNWHVAHLQNPKSFTPDTVMPEFGFSTDDAKALTLLILSWRNEDVPTELLPGAILADKPTPEEKERERMMLEGDGRFFVEKTCFICHDVSSFGIVSATKIGPDLALATDDVQRRFGRTLDDFLHNPSGTMSVVLSRQIHLTPEEVNEAVRLIDRAYEVHLQQHAAKESVKGGEESAQSAEPQSK